MCENIRKSKNDQIQETVGITLIDDNLMENKLRCFGHVHWRYVDVPVRMIIRLLFVDDLEEGINQNWHGWM